MELREIEIFLALADELHFGRTADHLGVTTARVSQTIKKLERRFGAPLFDRTSRKVALTSIGKQLYGDLRPAYDQIQQAIERAADASRGVRGVLRVGFFGAAAGRFVLEIAETFQSIHPETDVQIRENNFADGFGGLLNTEEIDLLMATLPMREPGLTHGPVLVREDRVIAVSARHPFASRPSVAFADLARDKVLRSPPGVPDYWDATLAPSQTKDGRPIERGPTFATIEEMLALIGAGKGMYPLPADSAAFYTRPDVTYVPIHDVPPYEWSLIWPTAAETNRIREFVRVASATAEAG